MRKFEISLSEDLAQQLEGEASRHALALEEYVIRLIEQRASGVMPRTHNAWIPREEWDALVRGEACPLCCALALDEPVNAHGYTVADLAVSRLRLAANQSVPGYCYLISKKHVREAYHLGESERLAFFADLMHAAEAIEKAFNAIKMNLEMLGNAVPHLHCHIKPRYYGDPAPGVPIHPDKNPLFLTPAEYEERVWLIRAALEK